MEMEYKSIVISSGHGLHVSGAYCPPPGLDEVTEARAVVDLLAAMLVERGCNVKTFHDDVSTTQNANLNAIVDFHNKQKRDLDISVHFNAAQQPTEGPLGTEVLYVSQDTLAADLSAVIASVGFIDRGAKKRTDLFFLNSTTEPAVLLEICFVNSYDDADIYRANIERICSNIAEALGYPGEDSDTVARVEINVFGNVEVVVNGKVVN